MYGVFLRVCVHAFSFPGWGQLSPLCSTHSSLKDSFSPLVYSSYTSLAGQRALVFHLSQPSQACGYRSTTSAPAWMLGMQTWILIHTSMVSLVTSDPSPHVSELNHFRTKDKEKNPIKVIGKALIFLKENSKTKKEMLPEYLTENVKISREKFLLILRMYREVGVWGVNEWMFQSIIISYWLPWKLWFFS